MNNLHILVVDDEVVILNLIVGYLTKRGYQCETAASGEQALTLVQQRDFDIMLADLTLSGLDGIELTSRVKALRPQTVCILMSGRGSRLDLIAAMQTGVSEFLDKPFSELAVVAMAIERAAVSRRLVRERDALLEDLKNQNAKLETSLARLHTAYGQLRQQEATLASDLRQSQRVQRKLLPAAFPVIEGFELFGYFGPCERLGGDFFGVVPLDDGRLAVYLVDVAGHGVSAAMITIILRELLQPRRLLQARNEILGTPDRALAFLNQALLEEAFNPPILVTMVYAVIDARNGTLTFASAGHPPPLVVDGPGPAHPLFVGGAALGLANSGAYTTATLALKPGDSVLLYSDGVSEARYEGGCEFTHAQLCTALAAQHGKNAAQMGRALEDGLRLHLASHAPADDMTFIVISRSAVSAPGSAPASDHRSPPTTESVRVVLPVTVPQTKTPAPGVIAGGWSAATCVIRLSGLATWQLAPAMRRLIASAETGGTGPIRIELNDCQSLDSTMLGLLCQFAKKLIIHRPSERVCAQFREMGIFAYLQISDEAAPETDTPLAVTLDASSAASSDLILSAHEALIEASEENRQRFQGVVSTFSSRKRQTEAGEGG